MQISTVEESWTLQIVFTDIIANSYRSQFSQRRKFQNLWSRWNETTTSQPMHISSVTVKLNGMPILKTE